MNQEPLDEDWIPDRNAGYRLPTPSVSLREKILREATLAWEEGMQAPVANVWLMPVLRLAASITIAVLIVSFANLGDQYSLAHWQPSTPATISSEETDSFDQLPEIHPMLMRIRRVASSSKSRGSSKDIILYLQRLRESVDDTNSPAVHDLHHPTETFINPWHGNQFINLPKTLES